MRIFSSRKHLDIFGFKSFFKQALYEENKSGITLENTMRKCTVAVIAARVPDIAIRPNFVCGRVWPDERSPSVLSEAEPDYPLPFSRRAGPVYSSVDTAVPFSSVGTVAKNLEVRIPVDGFYTGMAEDLSMSSSAERFVQVVHGLYLVVKACYASGRFYKNNPPSSPQDVYTVSDFDPYGVYANDDPFSMPQGQSQLFANVRSFMATKGLEERLTEEAGLAGDLLRWYLETNVGSIYFYRILAKEIIAKVIFCRMALDKLRYARLDSVYSSGVSRQADGEASTTTPSGISELFDESATNMLYGSPEEMETKLII
jgi:hypothetical protein